MPPCNLYTGTGASRSWDRRNFAGPFVTAVGGTMGNPPKHEVANPLSGGGFSYFFDTPDYQKIVVGNYVESIENKYEDLYRFVLSCCPK